MFPVARHSDTVFLTYMRVQAVIELHCPEQSILNQAIWTKRKYELQLNIWHNMNGAQKTMPRITTSSHKVLAIRACSRLP
jgi:hypothetical protein